VPYLSYTGAEYPEKGLFIAALSLSSLLFIPVMIANQVGLLYLRVRHEWIPFLAYLGAVCSMASATFLVLLASFDVEKYASTISSSFSWPFIGC